MKYLLLISLDRDRWQDMATWAPEEIKSSVDYMDVLLKELEAAGELVGSEGPMAEAKEFLAGFIQVDVPSVDRAIEVHPIWADPAVDPELLTPYKAGADR